MSEKHLYEKHLAEKLQQLSPPPDVDGNWQKMKALLDDDSPRGGAFKRWWRLGAIAGLLLIGSWIAVTQFTGTNEKQNLVTAGKPQPANVEEKKSSPGNTLPDSDDKTVANNSSSPVSTPVKEEPLVVKNANDKTTAPSSGFSENNRALPQASKTGTNKKVIVNVDIGNDEQLTRNSSGKRNKLNTNNGITLLSTKGNTNKKDNTNFTNNTNTNDAVRRSVELSPLDENVNYTGATTLAPADNLKTNMAALSLNVKEVLKSKSARAGKSRSERSFSFGFSLPLAFPLGDQKALSYNFNAGANAISDYIPSPHVQYRLNKKTYLQTELQFISPQYIRPILLYETRHSTAGNYMVYNSIYARKLYYFNLPVGIHHSPFPNFYMGTGLQFSSLLSGVGLYEETKRSMNGQPVSLVGEHYGRLSGDSLTNRMNTAEVRLMLEMNYYVNRFTFGLRYNQAFNNYVDFRIDNMSPYTFDKNKALQFYLRYNLWEDVRRRNSGKGSLSSK